MPRVAREYAVFLLFSILGLPKILMKFDPFRLLRQGFHGGNEQTLAGVAPEGGDRGQGQDIDQ
jgi:hypothetical protein